MSFRASSLLRRADVGAPPAIPDEFKIYDSYATDPKFQLYFTYAWIGLLGLTIVVSRAVPKLLYSVRTRRILRGWTIWESMSAPYSKLPGEKVSTPSTESWIGPSSRQVKAMYERIKAVSTWRMPWVTLPKALGGEGLGGSHLLLSFCQLVAAALYAAAVWVCVTKDAELKSNPNRFGFIALAQLTPLFLLTTKNNPLSFLIAMGYEKFNWCHRWIGRLLWLCATCHGAMWLDQYSNTPHYIQSSAKAQRGIIAYVFLTLIAVSSIKPIRQKAYNVFFLLHILSVAGFFAAIAYHTPYAQPWIFPPIALYAFDLFARILKCRIKDAVLVPLDGMTLIHIPDANRGWLPTQHVYLRVLSASWTTLESHPFTILSSPPSASSPSTGGITLIAGVTGSWTKSVRALASSQDELEKREDDALGAPVQVRVVLDGPYGGLGYSGLGEAEMVVCVAGGSGVSFLLGVAEEAREAMAQGKLRVVRLVWATKNYATFASLLPIITPLLSPNLTLSLYITGSELLPPLPPPHCNISLSRPSFPALLSGIIDEDGATRGVAVFACGPRGLMDGARMAVSALGTRRRVAAGGVDFWSEGFGL